MINHQHSEPPTVSGDQTLNTQPLTTAELYEVGVKPCAAQPDRAISAGDRCPHCLSESAAVRYEIEQTKFHIVDCNECGLGRMSPRPSQSEISAFYPPAYYGSTGNKFTKSIEWLVRIVGNRQARFIAKQLEPGASVLDVGCGRGVLLNGLAEYGFETHGTEMSDTAATGADARSQVHVVEQLSEADFPDDYFDCVVIWHVLEHLPNPGEVLLEAQRILRPGGRLIVSVPNYSSLQARLFGHAWFHLDPPRHLFHFPEPVLREMLQESGFQIESAHHFSLRQNPFGWIQSLLNLLPGSRRNQLYSLLQQQPQPTRSRFLQMSAWVMGMPFGLMLSVVAALFHQGATIHLVGTKTGDQPQSALKTNAEIPARTDQSGPALTRALVRMFQSYAARLGRRIPIPGRDS